MLCRPHRQACKQERAQSKDLEPDHDRILQRLNEAVHDTHTNVSPCQSYSKSIIGLKVDERQDRGVELRWLLPVPVGQ